MVICLHVAEDPTMWLKVVCRDPQAHCLSLLCRQGNGAIFFQECVTISAAEITFVSIWLRWYRIGVGSVDSPWRGGRGGVLLSIYLYIPSRALCSERYTPLSSGCGLLAYAHHSECMFGCVLGGGGGGGVRVCVCGGGGG